MFQLSAVNDLLPAFLKNDTRLFVFHEDGLKNLGVPEPTFGSDLDLEMKAHTGFFSKLRFLRKRLAEAKLITKGMH
jgi:hypothetical protein